MRLRQIDVAMADFRGANWKRCVSYFTLRWFPKKCNVAVSIRLPQPRGPDWLKQGRWPRREKWPPWPSSRGQVPIDQRRCLPAGGAGRNPMCHAQATAHRRRRRYGYSATAAPAGAARSFALGSRPGAVLESTTRVASSFSPWPARPSTAPSAAVRSSTKRARCLPLAPAGRRIRYCATS